MMSWLGTSRTVVRRETITARWKGRQMKTKPGPLGLSLTLPRVKTTARSYSLMTLRQLRAQITAKTARGPKQPRVLMRASMVAPEDALSWHRWGGKKQPTSRQSCGGGRLLGAGGYLLTDGLHVAS